MKFLIMMALIASAPAFAARMTCTNFYGETSIDINRSSEGTVDFTIRPGLLINELVPNLPGDRKYEIRGSFNLRDHASCRNSTNLNIFSCQAFRRAAVVVDLENWKQYAIPGVYFGVAAAIKTVESADGIDQVNLMTVQADANAIDLEFRDCKQE